MMPTWGVQYRQVLDHYRSSRSLLVLLREFFITLDSWSSPVTTGSSPSPCDGFSFLKVNNSIVILFGGGGDGYFDQLYTLDLNTMVRYNFITEVI